MALLTTGMMICYAHRGALSVAAPYMIKELNLSPTITGILLSAFFWLYSFMQMPAGWAVDRFGVKRAYALGFIVWSAASICTGFSGGLIGLILFRMLLGIGQSVAFPASSRAVANWFQNKERGTITAVYLTGVRLGQATIVAVGAYFLAVHSWKFFFTATGAIPVVWLAAWYPFLGRWEMKRRTEQKLTAPEAQPAANSLLSGFALLKERNVFGIFLGFFAYDYVWFLYISWLPGYLVLDRKFTSAEMGIYGSAPYLIMSVTIILSGFLSDQLIRRGYSEISVRKTFILVGLVIGLLIVPAGMVENKLTAVWLITLSLCGLGICSPNTWTLTQAVCSKNLVGTVTGIQNFGGNLGGVLAPAVTGYVAHTRSFAAALTIAGGMLILGIVSYAGLISSRQKIEIPVT